MTTKRQPSKAKLKAPVGRKLRAAAPKKPDPETRLLTADSALAPYLGIGGMMTRTNPGYFLQEVQPSSSAASAHGYTVAVSQYWDLLDEMMDRDTTISSCVGLLVNLILQRDRTIYIPEAFAEDESAQAARAFIEEVLEGTNFHYLLWSLLHGSVRHGFSACEIIWKVRPDGAFVPACFHHAHPGQFAFSRAGQMMLQQDYLTIRETPQSKFIVMRNPTLYDNPFGESLLFGLRWLWYWKKKALVGLQRFADKFGFPLLHGEIPKEQSNNKDLRDTLLETLADSVNNDAIVTSSGETITAISRNAGNDAKPHSEIISYADGAFRTAILGSELTTAGSKYGTRALGDVHDSTMDSRVLPMARLLEQAIEQFLFTPLIALNFPPGTPVPGFWVDTDDKADSQEGRSRLKCAMELSIPVAMAEAREILSLRAPNPGEEILEPVIPFPAPTPPETTNDESINASVGSMAKHLFSSKSVAGEAFRQAYSSAAVDRELAIHRQKDKAEAGIVEAVEAGMKEAFTVFLEGARKLDASGPIPPRLIHEFPVRFSGDTDLIARALWCSRILATCAMLEHDEVRQKFTGDFRRKQTFAAKGFEAFLDASPDAFSDAIRWMMNRKAMTKAQLERLAEAYAESSGLSLEAANREIRDKAIALAGSSSITATAKVQGFISSAVKAGKSLGEFLSEVDSMVAQGDIPGGADSYWENVMRTEMTAAYSKQQAIEEAKVASNLWGHEGLNPQDDRSREGHSHTSGVLFKAGSQAASILGRPPYAYQCRCALVPIIVPDPRTAGYTESPNALSVASSVERF